MTVYLQRPFDAYGPQRDMAAWDQCIQPSLTPTLERLPIYVGVDASVKRDSTALVAVSFDKKAQIVRPCSTACSRPRRAIPSILSRLLRPPSSIGDGASSCARSCSIRSRWWRCPQRLAEAHVPIEEYPQSVPNLTAATQNLFDLIQSRSLVLYPDAAMRLAVSRAVIVESSRGWRLDKLKQQHKIDVVVALSMACSAAAAWAGETRLRFVAPGRFD